jgi:hypothetical protein
MTEAEILAEIERQSSIKITHFVLHVHLLAKAATLQRANLSRQKSVEENHKFRLKKLGIQNSKDPFKKKYIYIYIYIKN